MKTMTVGSKMRCDYSERCTCPKRNKRTSRIRPRRLLARPPALGCSSCTRQDQDDEHMAAKSNLRIGCLEIQGNLCYTILSTPAKLFTDAPRGSRRRCRRSDRTRTDCTRERAPPWPCPHPHLDVLPGCPSSRRTTRRRGSRTCSARRILVLRRY